MSQNDERVNYENDSLDLSDSLLARGIVVVHTKVEWIERLPEVHYAKRLCVLGLQRHSHDDVND